MNPIFCVFVCCHVGECECSYVSQRMPKDIKSSKERSEERKRRQERRLREN